MATVILGCKTPNGFTMELNGKAVKINGSASEDGIIIYEKGEAIGITHDVDKSFWDAWRTKFAKHPLVAGSKPYNQPFVFEAKSEASLKAQAKEMKSVKTGLEQKTKAELDKVAGATENKDVE